MEVVWNWYTYTIIGAILLYICLKWKSGRLSRKNLKHLPYFPFLGSGLKMLIQKEHFKDFQQQLYNAFPNEKYVGFMQLRKPVIIIRDLQIVKQIAIKDFDHFTDHQEFISEDIEPIFANNLFSLKGQKWRDMRATLSPAFTSSKMRQMFEFITETGEEMAKYLIKQLEQPEFKERGLLEIEMKDAFTRYTNDVIATTAFGLKIDSLNDKKNEFYKMAKRSTDFSGIKSIKLMLFAISPKLMKLTGVTIFDKEENDFFYQIVTRTMKDREEKNIIRNDMIQILMETKSGSLRQDNSKEEKDSGFAIVEESDVGKQNVKRSTQVCSEMNFLIYNMLNTTEWTDNELVAQAVLFFIAGFDTSSTLLCFVSHMLAINPEIQKKLQLEVDEVLFNNDRINYNAVAHMKYMDMIISETLRMWPPVVMSDRECNSSYKLPPSNDCHPGYYLRKGDLVVIPMHSFHHDPKYFPNPEVFDPERFSDENKANIDPMSYMPFGVGPRNCIGSRFALLETKVVLFHLLAKFDFVETAKTSNPIQLATDTFNLAAKDGFWIGMKPRS